MVLVVIFLFLFSFFFFFIGMCWLCTRYLVVLLFRGTVDREWSVVVLTVFRETDRQRQREKEREREKETKGETRINLCTACALLGCFAPGVYCIKHHVLPPP